VFECGGRETLTDGAVANELYLRDAWDGLEVWMKDGLFGGLGLVVALAVGLGGACGGIDSGELCAICALGELLRVGYAEPRSMATHWTNSLLLLLSPISCQIPLVDIVLYVLIMTPR
jgi:hypothetical protein